VTVVIIYRIYGDNLCQRRGLQFVGRHVPGP
jgi:hypothetical protein